MSNPDASNIIELSHAPPVTGRRHTTGRHRLRDHRRASVSPAMDPQTRELVDGLLAAGRTGDRTVLPWIRDRIRDTSNPYLLATMASTLGRLGEPADARVLVPLLEHADARVVSNTLEALGRLAVPLPAPLLVGLALRPESRLHNAALAQLDGLGPERVLPVIRDLLLAPEVAVRTSAAGLLGELSEGRPAIELLLERLVVETHAAVLRAIGASLKRLGSLAGGELLVGRLYKLSRKTKGAQLDLVRALLHEIGVDSGWVEQQVRELGERYAARHPSGTLRCVLPPEPGAAPSDADLPLSFGALWGAPPSASCARARPATSPGPKGTLDARPPWQLALVATLSLGITIGIGFAPSEPEGRPRPTDLSRPPAATNVAAPAPATDASRTASPRPGVAGPTHGPAACALEAPSPFPVPEAAPLVTLEGEIEDSDGVTATLRCPGRSVRLRGRACASMRPGVHVRVQGRLAGATETGQECIELVDGDAR